MKRLTLFFILLTQAAFAQKLPEKLTKQISSSVFSLSQVMMHDVVNPPAASRYYAYGMLGAYEIVSQNDHTLPSLSTIIKDYKPIAVTNKNKYDPEIAAIYCILETGRLMLPSGFKLTDDEDAFLASIRQHKADSSVINASVAVAREMAVQIVNFSKTDHYNELSAKMHYRPVRDDIHWYPTPPAYMEAIEPHWKTVRPMVIDSCNEFMPKPPVTFSKDSSSAFYNLAEEVYNISKNRTKEQTEMAAFWDCNPFAVSTSGHMSIGFKKISPGGHWMSIAGIAAEKAHLSFDKSVLLHTVLSVTLMDALLPAGMKSTEAIGYGPKPISTAISIEGGNLSCKRLLFPSIQAAIALSQPPLQKYLLTCLVTILLLLMILSVCSTCPPELLNLFASRLKRRLFQGFMGAFISEMPW